MHRVLPVGVAQCMRMSQLAAVFYLVRVLLPCRNTRRVYLPALSTAPAESGKGLAFYYAI